MTDEQAIIELRDLISDDNSDRENEALLLAIEKLRDKRPQIIWCSNCKYYDMKFTDYPCCNCNEHFSKWETKGGELYGEGMQGAFDYCVNIIHASIASLYKDINTALEDYRKAIKKEELDNASKR